MESIYISFIYIYIWVWPKRYRVILITFMKILNLTLIKICAYDIVEENDHQKEINA